MTVTAQQIKELRERTGIGMGKCKEALVEAKGDMELAIKNLRKSGAATAVKKEGRTTSEGMIGFAQNGNSLAVVEINAETDFVVQNERFRDFVETIAKEVLKANPTTLETFLSKPYSGDPSLTIDQFRAHIVQTIGENIQISRLKTFAKSATTSFGVYSHHSGKIVSIVELQGSGDEEELAKEIAMHVAAAAPEYVSPEKVPAEVLAQEKEIARTQMKGKPENIVEKILEGKVRAYCDQHCLTCQKFVKDENTSIQELVSIRAKKVGKPLTVTDFTRWSVGQKS